MRRRMLGRKLTAMACGLAAGAVVLAGAPSASAESARAAEDGPALGISFTREVNAGDQCEGPQEQWKGMGEWTEPIRLNTDNRGGGCQLAFSVLDPDGVLAGFKPYYTWLGSDGDSNPTQFGQCGEVYGRKRIPLATFEYFPKSFRVDTDGRGGWCNLTFEVTGRSDIAIDVRFYGEDAAAVQCVGATPEDQPRAATNGSPVTIGVDTDNRPGGCWLSLRLRQR